MSLTLTISFKKSGQMHSGCMKCLWGPLTRRFHGPHKVQGDATGFWIESGSCRDILTEEETISEELKAAVHTTIKKVSEDYEK